MKNIKKVNIVLLILTILITGCSQTTTEKEITLEDIFQEKELVMSVDPNRYENAERYFK